MLIYQDSYSFEHMNAKSSVNYYLKRITNVQPFPVFLMQLILWSKCRKVLVYRSKLKLYSLDIISIPIRNLVHSDCGDVVFLEIGSSWWMRWRHHTWRLPISRNTTSPQSEWTRFLIGIEIYLVSTTLIWICILKLFYILIILWPILMNLFQD